MAEHEDVPDRARRSRQHRELQTVYEDDDLKVAEAEKAVAGLDAVVVFTGVGHRAGAIQLDEFVGTATTHGRTAIFVTDKQRSWFNAPGLYDKLVSEVKPRLSGSPRTLLVGNSMGATGALLFAAPLGAQSALAFGPQCSVSQRVIPRERRWRHFVDKIGQFTYEDMNDYLAAGIRYYVLHGTAGRDRIQSEAFRPRAELHRFAFPEERHNLTRMLKNANLLAPLFEAAIARDDAEIARILSGAGGVLADGSRN